MAFVWGAPKVQVLLRVLLTVQHGLAHGHDVLDPGAAAGDHPAAHAGLRLPGNRGAAAPRVGAHVARKSEGLSDVLLSQTTCWWANVRIYLYIWIVWHAAYSGVQLSGQQPLAWASTRTCPSIYLDEHPKTCPPANLTSSSVAGRAPKCTHLSIYLSLSVCLSGGASCGCRESAAQTFALPTLARPAQPTEPWGLSRCAA
jgi:hypothetical protein